MYTYTLFFPFVRHLTSSRLHISCIEEGGCVFCKRHSLSLAAQVLINCHSTVLFTARSRSNLLQITKETTSPRENSLIH